jgi:hypothetical protein
VEARARSLTSCETTLLSHDTERRELCVLAAPRRLADEGVALMRMAVADGGFLSTQLCHGDDFRLRLRARKAAPLNRIS